MHQITKKGRSYAGEIGSLHVTNFLPYVGRIIKVYVEDGETFTIYEPATLEESQRARGIIQEHYENEKEKRWAEARETTWNLCQQSWLDGIPEDAKIFCDAHQGDRDAHGSHRYDEFLLCNDCVGRVEEQIAELVIFDVRAWVQEQARYNKIHNDINQAETEGYKAFQLDGKRWIEILPLYKFSRGHKPDSLEKHYPHPDIYPTFYEGWAHDDKPGIQTTYFTSRNKLFNYFLNGGVIKEEEVKVPHPMDDEEDELPRSVKDLLDGNS